MPPKLQAIGQCEAIIPRIVRWGVIQPTYPHRPRCSRTAYHHKTIGGQLYVLCSQHAKIRSERLRLVSQKATKATDRR